MVNFLIMRDSNHIINEVTSGDYKYGFDYRYWYGGDPSWIRRGDGPYYLCQERNRNGLLEFRLKAFRHWQTLEIPTWPREYPPVDYQDVYYAALRKRGTKSLDEVDLSCWKHSINYGYSFGRTKHLSGMAVTPWWIVFQWELLSRRILRRRDYFLFVQRAVQASSWLGAEVFGQRGWLSW